MAPIPEASIAEKITDTARRIFTKKEFWLLTYSHLDQANYESSININDEY